LLLTIGCGLTPKTQRSSALDSVSLKDIVEHRIGKLAALKAKKIVWDPTSLDSSDTEIFVISIDGTDFKTWEKNHGTMPVDREGQMSHKFNHGAVKYKRDRHVSLPIPVRLDY
jgi:hypothetical protein